MTTTLAGKVALVTGGSRGLGAAIAKRLAHDGAAVALTYTSSPQKADQVVRDIEAAGGKALAIRADSADVEAVKHAVAETVNTLGRLDILVNNAGVAAIAPIDQFSIDEFDRLLAVNVKGVFVATQEAIRHMGEGGRIISELKMQLISVNVGLPCEVTWKGKTVSTGIFKAPVNKRVRVRTLNLDGDGQADLTVHGGADKAVYVYPFEYYEYWRSELPDTELSPGIFGENFTTTGLSEAEVNIGDCFQIGTVKLMVTQPRMPCYKMGIRFGRSDMVKRFLASRRTGFYFRVLQEGEIGTGDTLELVSRDENNITVADITQLYVRAEDNPELLHRAAQLEALPKSWRDYFQR